ncbi:NAD(P)/FAD-dependent oxidoreductase [Actinoplanes couchii]|uniref:NAD(P)/FAD-dependent oxidoreductase n=1 Tax=Actinoplanes couchii TaxID=403638 RepID=UPI001940C9EC|nr:FAD-dependent oxidoreductase [Actinoplanes couchii]MDR6321554.1 NADPH-dependent 2,4-dienoyl-CoA reductase/sulfur reductase-like enzyme [Actinoplanes couchii]
MQKVAIAGASLAGLAAARALRRQSFAGEIVIVGDEPHPPYDRPPLSKEFLTGTATMDDIALGGSADLDVEWRLGTPATGIDAPTRSLRLADGTEIRADALIVATGARARELGNPGGLTGLHTLRTLDDAIALRADLRPGARLVVIGAGFIGAEVASSARSLGLDVTVVETLPTPLAGPLGPEMGGICAQLHGDHGVPLLTGVPVSGLSGTDRVEAVELADGTRLPADVVVAGIGSLPNVEWLAGSGLEIAGGVVTDASGATSVPGVWATGDCAVIRGERRSEHWTHAVEHSMITVAALLGDTAPVRKAPYFWSDQYGARIQFAGHHEPGDAVRVVEGDPDSRSFLAVYERDSEPVAVLGMNQPKLFTRWRRQLRATPQEA